MGNPVRWLSLALCLHGLKSDLIVRISPPFSEFRNYSCLFPFVYDDIVYYNCISIRSDYAWCSIDEIFQGRWRYCTAEDPPSCTFPFLYRDKYFYTCTKEGYVLSRSWCSLTRDYNKDGKWKQCSPYQMYNHCQPFKNEKTASSQAIQKQMVGWIWPAGSSLLPLAWMICL